MKMIFVFLVLLSAFAHAGTQLTNQQIQQKIIQESVARYPGRCPCPFSTARNGSNCGGRSAYSKPGGYKPICYPSDVSEQMIKQYRQRLSR